MAVINPPLWLQAGAYTARQDRRLISSMLRDPGVAGASELFVSQRAAGANMSVDVAEGRAFIRGTEAATQGSYHVESQGATNVIIGAAHATLARYDLIVARVRDAEYSGATNAWALEVVAGTASGSPVEPTAPASSITLARVSVAAAASSITGAAILDRRPYARFHGTMALATSTAMPSLLTSQEGDIVYALDTNRVYINNGVAWVGLGASAAPAPLSYVGSVAPGASLTFANLITQNSIIVAPYPLTMVVSVTGDMGANAASNTVNLQIVDEGGINIAHAGAISGGTTTVKNFTINEGRPFAMMGRKSYTTGQTCGFRFGYKVDTSHIYLSALAVVTFYPV